MYFIVFFIFDPFWSLLFFLSFLQYLFIDVFLDIYFLPFLKFFVLLFPFILFIVFLLLSLLRLLPFFIVFFSPPFTNLRCVSVICFLSKLPPVIMHYVTVFFLCFLDQSILRVADIISAHRVYLSVIASFTITSPRFHFFRVRYLDNLDRCKTSTLLSELFMAAAGDIHLFFPLSKPRRLPHVKKRKKRGRETRPPFLIRLVIFIYSVFASCTIVTKMSASLLHFPPYNGQRTRK